MTGTALGKRKSTHDGGDRLPKRQNVAELYAPTMVTIHISNVALTGEDEEPEEEDFQVPRGLICAYSPYFDNVFRKQFAESGTGRSFLDDVRPWAFRVFVGWLYFQRIAYVGDRTEPQAFRSSDDATAESDFEESMLSIRTASTSGSVRRLAKGPSHKWCSKDNCATCQMTDDLDPLTWSWQDLFELYVFGEKYDARGFRMGVLDIIQRKYLIRDAHNGPGAKALNYLFDNLPAGSLVLDMMVKIYFNKSMSLSILTSKMNSFSEMPAPFLAMCLLAAAKKAKALKCSECNPGIGRHGHADSHCRDDLLSFEHMDTCKYHEHGDDLAERARCKASMDAWLNERLQAEHAEVDNDATS